MQWRSRSSLDRRIIATLPVNYGQENRRTGDASARLFLNNPAMDGTAKLAPAFVGRDRSDTTWSETMLLYCLYHWFSCASIRIKKLPESI